MQLERDAVKWNYQKRRLAIWVRVAFQTKNYIIYPYADNRLCNAVTVYVVVTPVLVYQQLATWLILELEGSLVRRLVVRGAGSIGIQPSDFIQVLISAVGT